MNSSRASSTSNDPDERGLFVFRVAWVLVALLALAITAASVPALFERFTLRPRKTPRESPPIS